MGDKEMLAYLCKAYPSLWCSADLDRLRIELDRRDAAVARAYARIRTIDRLKQQVGVQ